MVTLLFADDEQIIREGMRSFIDWESLGVKWLEAAKNGREALEKIQSLKPDIVLLDIKMPEMSGLEVIRRANLLGVESEFLIYSGYDEFEYAREAMSYGVRHYLLKPVSERQLVPIIRELVETIESGKAILAHDLTLVDRIKRYVSEHLSDQALTLKKISEEELFLNPKYVSRAFYQKTGQHFRQYVLEQRMELAKQMLLQEDASRMYEIASRVGLDDNPQYFSKLFKKYTGYTPSEYRRCEK